MPFLLRWKERLARRSTIGWSALLAIVLTLPSLGNGFNADDHYVRMVLQGFPGLPDVAALPGLTSVPLDMFAYADGRPAYNQVFMDRGLIPWWSTKGLRFRRLHPTTGLTHWLDEKLFGDEAWPAHLHSLLWYGAVVLCVGLLYRRFIGADWVAGLAVLLFALDDAHGRCVGWISNRNAFVPALFGFLTLYAYDRWRRDNRQWGLWLGLLALALGVLSDESAVATGAYLVAYACFLDKGRWTVRLTRLLPFAAVGALWLLFYRHYGFGVYGSGIYVDPISEFPLFLRKLVVDLPILLVVQLGLPMPNPAFLLGQPPSVMALAAGAALLQLAVLLWGIWPLVRHDALVRFWLVGMVLAVIPSTATLPDKRLLFFAGLGGMGIVARFLCAHAETSEYLTAAPARRRGTKALAGFWIVVHLVLAPLVLPWESTSIALFSKPMDQGNATAPNDREVTHQALVIVNAPSDVTSLFLPAMRSSLRQSVPAHMWTLTAGTDPIDITRPDSRTLVLAPANGFAVYPWGAIYRGPNDPSAPGDVIRLSGLTVRVVAVTADQRPDIVEFRFDEPLESSSLRWVTWQKDGYVPFTPPQVGHRVRVMPGTLPRSESNAPQT